MKRLSILLILICFIQLVFSQKSFNISSNTYIEDVYGKQVAFNEFIILTDKYEYNLKPVFNDNDELVKIILDLFENNHLISSSKQTNTAQPENTFEENTTFYDYYTHFTNVNQLEGLDVPTFKTYDINNQPVDLSTLQNKVVIINFWFSRCIPCRNEIPDFNKLAQKYRNNKDVVFLALAIEKKADTERFLAKQNFDFKIIPQAYKIAANYKVAGYPTTLVINKNKVVDKVVVGEITNVFDTYDRAISKCLLQNSNDLKVEPFSDLDDFFFSQEEVYDKNGTKLGEKEFYEILLSGNSKLYKHTRKNGTFYYTLQNH